MAPASSPSDAVRGSPGQRLAWPQAVRVIEEDPDLGAAISGPHHDAAIRAAIAPGFELPRGPWDFRPPADPAALGALILGGLLIVRVESGDRAHIELLGDGDVISPWVGSGGDLNLPSDVSARIVSPLRLVLLDRRFALRTARWPEIQAVLMRRLIARSRRLSLQAAINAVPRVEERLELTLWQLGDRWGRVTPNGIMLRLALTHQLLGELIAAQRPSVSTALSTLERRQRVLRPALTRLALARRTPGRATDAGAQGRTAGLATT